MRQDNVDRIRRSDGRAFTEAGFEVPTTYVPLPKDYAPFARFGDGGLLIYSGRFHACSGTCPDSDSGDEGLWRMTVSPPAGDNVIVEGKVHQGATTWRDTSYGTKVYTGPARPVQTPRFIVVIDSTFPARLREDLLDELPGMMDWYDERLGALSFRPVLFASLDAAYADGDGSQGGTLPGQIFMHHYGPGWGDDQRDAEQELRLRWFFAHEGAHLYQPSKRGRHEAEQAWLHEGGAEALAALTLLGLDAVPDEYVNRRVAESETACAEALTKRVLKDAARDGTFSDYYHCGLLMHLIIDAAARRDSGGERDLFTVWRRFLEEIAAGTEWSQDSFLAVVEAETGAETAAYVRSLANERQADPAATLRRGLQVVRETARRD